MPAICGYQLLILNLPAVLSKRLLRLFLKHFPFCPTVPGKKAKIPKEFPGYFSDVLLQSPASWALCGSHCASCGAFTPAVPSDWTCFSFPPGLLKSYLLFIFHSVPVASSERLSRPLNMSTSLVPFLRPHIPVFHHTFHGCNVTSMCVPATLMPLCQATAALKHQNGCLVTLEEPHQQEVRKKMDICPGCQGRQETKGICHWLRDHRRGWFWLHAFCSSWAQNGSYRSAAVGREKWFWDCQWDGSQS